MIRLIFLGCLIICCALISCSENNNEVIVSTHVNGQVRVKHVFPFATDTSKYIQLVYFDDGRLADSGMIVNGRFEGERKIYDDQERKTYVTNYLEGVERGVTRCFYDNGTLYYRGQLFGGHEIGSYYFYEDDGSLLEYDYYIISGVAYRWEFDADGNYVRSFGSALVQYRTKMDSAKADNIFPIEIDLAVPEGYVSSIDEASTRNLQPIEFESEKTIGDTRTMIYNYIPKQSGNDTVYFHWNVIKIGAMMRDSGMTAVPIIVVD